jgi:SAM-dependent methyltransferase
MLRLSDIVPLFRFRKLRSYLKSDSPVILDIGCAGATPRQTHKRFPKCTYDGIDIVEPADAMRPFFRNFFLLDVSRLEFGTISDGAYDAIVMSHVVEHIRNGVDVIRAMAPKLKPGGVLYVEFPADRSLGMPNAVGTLQFCDDETHVRVYTIAEVANAMLDAGLRVEDAGKRRDWVMTLITPLSLPIQLHTLWKKGRLHAGMLYDLFGFADFVIGVRTKQT